MQIPHMLLALVLGPPPDVSAQDLAGGKWTPIAIDVHSPGVVDELKQPRNWDLVRIL